MSYQTTSNKINFNLYFGSNHPNFYQSLFHVRENFLDNKIPRPQSINQQTTQCYLNSQILLTKLNSLNPHTKTEQPKSNTKIFKITRTQDNKDIKKPAERSELKDQEDSKVLIKNETFEEESKDSLLNTENEAKDEIVKQKSSNENDKKKRLAERKKKNFWLPFEDGLLTELLKIHGEKWSKIASYFKDRTGKQVRDRYVNYLKPSIKQKQWTPEEEALLDKLYLEFGKRWSSIATYLPGRTENQVKNNFYARFRRGDFEKKNLQISQLEEFKQELPLRLVKIDPGFQALFNSELKTEFTDLGSKPSKSEEFENCDLVSHSTQGRLTGVAKVEQNSKVDSNYGGSPIKEEPGLNLIRDCSILHKDQIKLKEEEGILSVKYEEDLSDPYKKIKYECSETENILNVKQEVL